MSRNTERALILTTGITIGILGILAIAWTAANLNSIGCC